jgi:hypothetical protein
MTSKLSFVTIPPIPAEGYSFMASPQPHHFPSPLKEHTMKVFAIASAPNPLTPDMLQQHLPNEVPATLKLYLDGKVEQFWFQEKAGPIFLMNVESIDEAKATLNTLPLVADGLMKYEYLPVGPLAPLRLLIQNR